MNKTPLLAGTAIAAGIVLAVGLPISASAHVGLGTNQADPGTSPIIDFRVPTESTTATTTIVAVSLPAETPFAEVAPVPVAGWDTQLVRDGDLVTQVIWTAQPGEGLTSDEYGVFPVLLGGVPDTGSIIMPVQQTYSDGTVVDWADTGDDAENEAPILYVNDEPPADHHATGSGDAAEESPEATVSADAAPASDAVARGLGIGGLVVGAVGVVVALLSRRRSAA